MGENTITTEEKLKIENETLSLKREYKHALENLTRVKADTNEIIATKERINKQINETNEELNKTLLDISSAKLNWMTEKEKDLQELAKKNSEADNIIKTKEELNIQMEQIRKIELNNIEVLNETRRLELKVEADSNTVKSRERQLIEDRKIFDEEKLKIGNDKEDFKNKVAKILNEIIEL